VKRIRGGVISIKREENKKTGASRLRTVSKKKKTCLAVDSIIFVGFKRGGKEQGESLMTSSKLKKGGHHDARTTSNKKGRRKKNMVCVIRREVKTIQKERSEVLERWVTAVSC